jgi:hypothetical protein
MPETASPYRSYLEELAESRGLASAEELAQAAATADPEFSAQEILEDPPNGYGEAIDRAISLNEEEKLGLSRAWMHTYMRP